MIKKFLNYVCPGYLKPEIEFADGKKKSWLCHYGTIPFLDQNFPTISERRKLAWQKECS